MNSGLPPVHHLKMVHADEENVDLEHVGKKCTDER
jgi:hypothetical protein